MAQKVKKFHVPAEVVQKILQENYSISGVVEKKKNKWENRWLQLVITSRSLHYFLSEDHQRNNKVRGIYPLTGGSIKRERPTCDDHYPFTIKLSNGKDVQFRCKDESISQAWIALLETITTQDTSSRLALLHQYSMEGYQGELEVKKTTWKSRYAVVDADSRILHLNKNSENKRESTESQAASPTSSSADEYHLSGIRIQQCKSYGKTYEFLLLLPGSKEVKLRVNTEEERQAWCEALQGIANNHAIPLQASGLRSGYITAQLTTESSQAGPIDVVALHNFREFQGSIQRQVDHNLQPQCVVHEGQLSKVYHTSMRQVSNALNSAGFTLNNVEQEKDLWTFVRTEYSEHSSTNSTRAEQNIATIAKTFAAYVIKIH